MVKAVDFTLIAGQLYKLGPDDILRRYVLEHERQQIIVGGHYSRKPTVQKVLTTRLWWPTLHKDVKKSCRSCDVCQHIGRPSRRDEMPLKPQVTMKALDKWDIDFVGPINPPGKRTGSRYIIIATDYLTRWVEARLVKDCSAATAVQFIF